MLFSLYSNYSEPHRKYHNLKHIMRMFEVAREQQMKLLKCQIEAIWLHDIVYNVPSKEKSNEELSALFAQHHCNVNGDVVARIIRDTERELPSIPESNAVIDLDLWDLSDKDRFDANNPLIRAEFAHLSEHQWLTGRAAWLRSFLDRKTIFVSEYATDKMEHDARMNLSYDLGVVKYLLEGYE